MHVVNTNAFSHRNKSPEKCIQIVEKYKNNNYLESYLQKSFQLSHFVVLVDGLLGVEAEAIIIHTSIRLKTKCNQTYLQTYGYVKSRVSITMVRSTHRCIRGSQALTHKISVQ